jgi:hypothetical protein
VFNKERDPDQYNWRYWYDYETPKHNDTNNWYDYDGDKRML